VEWYHARYVMVSITAQKSPTEISLMKTSQEGCLFGSCTCSTGGLIVSNSWRYTGGPPALWRVYAVTLVLDRWGSMGPVLQKIRHGLAKEVRNPVFVFFSLRGVVVLRWLSFEIHLLTIPISRGPLAILRRSHDLDAVNNLPISSIHSAKIENQRMIH